MSISTPALFAFQDTFARSLEGLSIPWRGAEAPDPHLLVLNAPLAETLGADPAALQTPDGIGALAGSGVDGVAMAYAGHQFGAYSPRLGDGRALLLGEVIDRGGVRRDIHLKGSGHTPFARGGDGKAAVGPMLREVVISEAMHALGIPTTRALAVVGTGATVRREVPLPGAVLARVAASHIRVGTFQYALANGGADLVRKLSDYAMARHYPEAEGYLGFYTAVVERQAALLAQWMLAGFVHGVMNTDNMAISGETIDYGPCAFMDAFDPGAVFSSIDHGGRYAYGNQPLIAQWNLARLGETLLSLFDAEAATEAVNTFPAEFNRRWYGGLRARLGLAEDTPEDKRLVDDFAAMMAAQKVDYTNAVRGVVSGAARDLFTDVPAYDEWEARRRARPQREPEPHPIYIPRNHLVEVALTAATEGDMGPFGELLQVVTDPFTERPGLERYAEPDPAAVPYVTYCGT